MRRILLIAFLALAPAAQAADRARVKEIGQSLMCTCGCNQLLAGCNHLDCPRSIPMEKELAGMIDKGMSRDQILAAFVDKYGVKVLSAPPTKGAFNISAWIMPFVALLAGGFMVIFLLKTWRARTTPVPLGPVDDARYRQQLEEELKKFTPED
jgi:cytochrome c-type biogenesis protein CcmH